MMSVTGLSTTSPATHWWPSPFNHQHHIDPSTATDPFTENPIPKVPTRSALRQPRLCILGAGPAGFALAVDLQNHGSSVLLYSHPEHRRHANHVISNGYYLHSHGAIEGVTEIRISFDIREVVEFSRTLILTVPSTGQETLLRELKRFDLRQYTVLAIPGNLFALVANAEMEIGCILETDIAPYSCRMNEGELTVFGKKSTFSIASLQTPISSAVKDDIQKLFPQQLRWSSNVVEVSLSNINGVFHPLMMLMNAGRIESTGGDFRLYCDGLTQSVANAIIAIDRVRLQVGRAFGFKLDSVVVTSNKWYEADFKDLVDLAQNSQPHKTLMAPAGIDNRNITEDVPDLLVCWHGLAEKLGIDSSPIEAVINLASMAIGTSYMEHGRNLRKIHLHNLSRNELLDRFKI